MKEFLFISLLILFIGFTNLLAQTEQMKCIPTGTENVWEGQIGGFALPSEGIINVLFIFAQFPDDKYDTTNPTWVKAQAPTYMQNWVDQAWCANPTQGSMTHYFNEMSFNKLKFIGKTVSVVTPHTRAWYLENNKKRGDIHTEIIKQLDQTLDFAEFDNWDYEGPYNHINRSDGIVDMVFIVWRNIANEFPKNPTDSVTLVYQKLDMGRSADLGWGWPDILVDGGQRRLKMGFWPSGNTPGGSGVTLTDWFTEHMFRFCIHEFGHYLQGGNDQHVGFGFWGLLSGWGVKSFVANSFERYRLGWINLNTIQSSPNQTIQNATLPDYLTTGIAYRLVIDADKNQYFYIENHQNHTRWKYPNSTIENGIYILRQDGNGGNNTFMQLIAADGRWNWTVNQRVKNPWGSNPDSLPVFKRLGPDRVNGYHDLQFIPWTWNGVNQTPQAIHFTENSNGQPILDVRYSGDGKDAFRLGYNEVWSPYSNPSSQRSNKGTTPFGIKLNSLSNGVYSIDIYVGTSLNAPPSKPQQLSITCGANSRPLLRWFRNEEPDMNRYKIYKKVTEEWGYQYLAETTDTFYVDNSEICITGPLIANERNVYYRITAVDNSNKESVPSDAISTRVEGPAMEKVVSRNKVFKYLLSQNHPNPFNPITKIRYTIEKVDFVTLKVLDLLGREIAILVNEQKQPGEYEVEFNANKYGLSSGIYLYQLHSGSFAATKKLIYLK